MESSKTTKQAWIKSRIPEINILLSSFTKDATAETQSVQEMSTSKEFLIPLTV